MPIASKRKLDTDEELQELVDHRKVPPYDPAANESTIGSVVSSPSWSALERGRHEIYRLIAESFEECQPQRVQAILERAQRALQGQNHQPVIVCFSGNMGAGKSATLNSILQVGDIARSEDKGTSCTLASNIFSGPITDQESAFVAKVVFFSPEERREILSGYLRDYYRASNEPTQEEDGSRVGRDDDDNPTIKHDVVKALFSLFRDQGECHSKEAVREFLETAESENDAEIPSKLLNWSDILIDRIGKGTGSVVVHAATPGDLLANLTDYTAEAEEDDGEDCDCSLWPLVSLVEYHFDDSLFKHGIKILDTPGTSDLNSTRRQSAAKYARLKTHLLIISDAGRAQDDPTVARQVKQMRGRGRNRSIIVIPKSDLIGQSTLPSGGRRMKEAAKMLRDKHAEFEAQSLLLEDAIANHEEAGGDDTELVRLNKKKQMLDVQVKHAANAEIAHRIKMRNDTSKTVLQEKLRDYTKEPIPVVSVSNKCYAEHLHGFMPKRAPVLTVEETNIPTLRQKLCAFPNEIRLSEVQHLQFTAIPNLLARLWLFTSQSPTERRAKIEDHVLSPCKEILSIIQHVMKDFQTNVSELVLRPLIGFENRWFAAASDLCDRWNKGFNSAQHLKLMQRNGHRKGTKKVTTINMNGDLISLSHSHVDSVFGALTRSFIAMRSDLEGNTRKLFETMLEALRTDANADFVDLEPYIAFLDTGKGMLVAAIDGIAEVTFTELENIRSRAACTEEDAYLASSMTIVYSHISSLKQGSTDAKRIKYTKPLSGWPAHRKAEFKKLVTKPNGIWISVCKAIESDIRESVAKETSQLCDKLGAIFADFHAAFVDMFAVVGAEGPDEEARSRLADNLQKAQAILEGEMLHAYTQLRRDFHA